MARLDRPAERDRRGHDPAAADRRRDHRAAAPPAAARPPARDARPAVRGPAGRPADGQLAPRRVRGARASRSSAAASSSTSTWPRGGAVAAASGVLLRSPLRVRRRLPRAKAVSRRWAAAVVRRDVGRAVDRAPARRVRARLPSVRAARRRRSCGRWPTRCTRPGATCPSSRSWAASAARFRPASGVADLAEAAEAIPAQLEAGYTTICFKPSQFTDDPAQVGRLCRQPGRLIAAENSAVRSTDGLDVAVEVEGVVAALAADARVARAAERRLEVAHVEAVDPHGAGDERRADPLGRGSAEPVKTVAARP